MFKLTQFADNTTIILGGIPNSLQAALNILEIFGEILGLKINSEKTPIILIGSEVTSRRKYHIMYGWEVCSLIF